MIQPDPKKSKVKVVEKKTTVTTKPKAKTASQRIGDLTLRDVKDSAETALNLSTLGGYGVAKKKIKELTGMKSGGTMKKAQGGLGMKSVKSGFDKNSGVTRADFVAIGKGTAKSGAKMKKAQGGEKLIKSKKEELKKRIDKLAPKKQTMKAGGKMAKCKYGCK